MSSWAVWAKKRRFLFWVAQSVLIVTALLGGIKTVVDFLPSKQPLVADWESVQFALPQEIVSQLDNLFSLESQELSRLMKEKGVSARAMSSFNEIKAPLTSYMKGQFHEDLRLWETFQFNRTSVITVRNRGERLLTGVMLRTGGASDGYVRIAREGQEPVHKMSRGVIEIGELKPQEAVSIQIWGLLSYGWYTGERGALTHSSGIGDIVLWGPKRTWFQSLIESYRIRWELVVIVALALSLVVVLRRRLRNVSGSSPDGE